MKESKQVPHRSQGTAGDTITSRPWQDDMKALAPQAHERLMKMYDRNNWPGLLPPTLLHLLWIAVDAVPTHLYPPGIELHARMAIQHGASVAQVVEALEIATTVCERSLVHALPAVIKAARESGHPTPDTGSSLSEEQQRLRTQYEAREGVWPPGLDLALQLVPGFLRGLFAMSHEAAVPDGLNPKWRAMIMLAVHSCPAVLDVDAVKLHTKRCLEFGASTEELVEVVLSASGIGVHAYSLGIPEVKNALRVVSNQPS